MSADSSRAVFLSYASQDAAAAQRIAAALRSAGVEVWFDQNELVGGDAWDAKIRRQIKDCALFVPVISANTQARREGYFRLEWRLAVERMQQMDDDLTFLLPVVIDDTTDAAARVPDKFREVQWTRLSVKHTPESLAARVAKVLTTDHGTQSTEAGDRRQGTGDRAQRVGTGRKASRWRMLQVGLPIFGVAMAMLLLLRDRSPGPAVTAASKPAEAPKSEAKQLTGRARDLYRKLNSNIDDFATAETLLRKAAALDPTDGEVWAAYSLLNSYYQSRGFDRNAQRGDDARAQAEKAMKLAPELAESWHAVGRAVWTTDVPRARAALEKSLALATDGRTLLSLGSLARLQGRYDEAIAYYERAAKFAESRALACYDQFLIRFYQRRFAEADRHITEAIAVEPTGNFSAAQSMLATTWKGDPELALKILTATAAEFRGDQRITLGITLAQLMRRQPDEALGALQRITGDYINDAWFTGPKGLLVGQAHQLAGRPEAARVAWEAALGPVRRRLQETPNDAEQHTRLGELLAWTGKTDEALREARIATELTRFGDWIVSPVRVYAALGRADEALPLLEKLLTQTGSSRWPLTPALLRIDPVWDKLRGDPRFQALCTEPAPAAEAKSVAVLAFADQSPAHDSEYFSDGISEELINTLGKIPTLKVPARTSSFSFKGKSVPVREIAQQLGVAYVIEGSVQRAGDKVKIHASLTQAADGFQVWTDSFTRDAKDVFAVEEEIAGLIAQNLSVRLGVSGSAPRPVHPEAHRLALEGRYYWNLRTDDGFDRAEAAFRQAVELDPSYPAAHAGLALVLGTRSAYQAYVGILPRGAETERALAQRVLALDPLNADGYAALAQSYFSEGKLAEAAREFQKGLALLPNAALLHHWYSLVLEDQGRLDAALDEITRATQLDPLSGIALLTQVRMLTAAGRYAEALALQDRAVGLFPVASETATAYQATSLLRLNRRDEAARAARALGSVASMNRRINADAVVIYVLRETGHEEEASAYAQVMKTRLRPDSYQQGMMLAALGRWDEAQPFLERTPVNVHYVYFWDPLWDRWRDDARFRQLLTKLGCAEAYQVARETLARMQREAGKK